MKIGPTPEGLAERLALRFDLAPIPIAHTQIAMTAARAIMAGSTLGLFEAIAEGHVTADAIATACKTDPRATKTLADTLVAVGYLELRAERYRNARIVREWLLGPRSLKGKLAFQALEWSMLGGLEDFVRTGAALDLHATLDAEGWARYQEGMRALAAGIAPMFAKHVPVPKAPRRMLDVGGAHGLYAAALCARHPTLSAEVLELPEAIASAAPILARADASGRVRHRAGDVLAGDLGGPYDLVLMNNLVHHFDAAQNEAIARHVAASLAPGGYFVIGDVERSSGDAMGGVLDLYFALTSTSGTWPAAEMARWQTAAGLRVQRARRPRLLPGYVLQAARREVR